MCDKVFRLYVAMASSIKCYKIIIYLILLTRDVMNSFSLNISARYSAPSGPIRLSSKHKVVTTILS